MNIFARVYFFTLLLTVQHVFAHDLNALPLGDNKLSNAPKAGWIWPCRIEADAGGAGRDGPWINKSNGTYDLTRKAVVPGAVNWPSRYTISLQNDKRIFSANDLPSHATGNYPVPSDSEAYRYDRNPNRIKAQNIQVSLPANPVLAAQATCAPGAVGFLLSGSVLFNALDAPGRDAVAHETQDSCQGHPQVSGVYHYHSVSTCVDKKRDKTGHSELVGYMLDGFGIFGRYGEQGKLLTSQDLDECHGHTHEILWDGKRKNMYHYHATWDFPYSAGCMRGKYSMRDVMTISGPPPADRMDGGNQRPNGNQGNMPPNNRMPNNEMGRGDMRGNMGRGDMPPNDGQQGRRPPPEFGGQGGFEGGPNQGGPNGPSNQGGPGPGGRHPDLNKAAAKLGVDAETLRRALGPPPPDLSAAASRLGISEQQLKAALDASF